MAKRRMERERGRREAVADMSEDLSEGEKGDAVGDLSLHGESNRGRLPRISSVDTLEAWTNQQKGKNLYIVLIRYDIKLFYIPLWKKRFDVDVISHDICHKIEL